MPEFGHDISRVKVVNGLYQGGDNWRVTAVVKLVCCIGIKSGSPEDLSSFYNHVHQFFILENRNFGLFSVELCFVSGMILTWALGRFFFQINYIIF